MLITNMITKEEAQKILPYLESKKLGFVFYKGMLVDLYIGFKLLVLEKIFYEQ